MKRLTPILTLAVLLATSCTSTKKLSYLNNLPESSGEQYFTVEAPLYKIQKGDVLYITVKAMTPDGFIADYLSTTRSNITSSGQGESGQFLFGYDVNPEGNIILPVIGTLKVAGLTLEDSRRFLQHKADSLFNKSTVECKLLSFKYTVIGEVHGPGTFTNSNNYLTVLEAIGKAGGIGDYGNRDRVLVIRPTDKGPKTYRLNLHDKSILSSEAYYLMPNDIVIVEPQGNKIFNVNLPTISFIFSAVTSTITMTLLLINYFGK
jgi:polysaccharide export outer membrane protein